MKKKLTDRLNQILPELTSKRFLQGTGLGNEIAFYIFDYPASEELRVRDHIRFIIEKLPQEKPDLKFAHVNLFEFILDYLRHRKYLDQSIESQKKRGNDFLLKALKGILAEDKIARYFSDTVKPENLDFILISGVGSAYPLIRSHTLLNNLHTVMGNTPLVMFYPGNYDRTNLKLFGKTGLIGSTEAEAVKSTNYYRAFKLVD